MQDIAGSLKMWLRLNPEIDRLAAHSIGVLAVDMFVYGGTYLLMYFIFRPYTREPEKRFDSKIKAFFSILVIIFTISMARMTQGNPERNAMAQAAESIYQIICGVFILFMQSPYTQYDKENGVEKAAIELVGYTKVDVPANSAVTAAVSVAKSEMRAYDANGAKTYIVDAGNYYFSVGNGAHDALNNVLALKSRSGDTSNGTVDENRMTSAGNADFAAVYTVAEQDNTTYSMAVTGNPVTNQLDHADINKADSDASANMKIIEVTPWWKTAIIVADAAFGVLAAGSIFMLVRSFKKGKATS